MPSALLDSLNGVELGSQILLIPPSRMVVKRASVAEQLTGAMDLALTPARYVLGMMWKAAGGTCDQDICSTKMAAAQAQLDSENDDSGAQQLAHSAEKRAIHEAWLHARAAQDAAKEAADGAMQAIEEVSRIQKFLDPHDVIRVEGATELDTKKAVAASNAAF